MLLSRKPLSYCTVETAEFRESRKCGFQRCGACAKPCRCWGSHSLTYFKFRILKRPLIEREERAITERAEQENRAIRAKLKKEREQYSLANQITERMLKIKPEFFLKKINEVVEKVWAQLEPREKSGAFKAMPIFTGGVDGLMIHVATWKEPKRLSNPIYRLQYQRRVTLWTNEVWLEAVNGIQTLLDDFIKEELSEASLCQ